MARRIFSWRKSSFGSSVDNWYPDSTYSVEDTIVKLDDLGNLEIKEIGPPFEMAHQPDSYLCPGIMPALMSPKFKDTLVFLKTSDSKMHQSDSGMGHTLTCVGSKSRNYLKAIHPFGDLFLSSSYISRLPTIGELSNVTGSISGTGGGRNYGLILGCAKPISSYRPAYFLNLWE
jgi:hypothetical protein